MPQHLIHWKKFNQIESIYHTTLSLLKYHADANVNYSVMLMFATHALKMLLTDQTTQS